MFARLSLIHIYKPADVVILEGFQPFEQGIVVHTVAVEQHGVKPFGRCLGHECFGQLGEIRQAIGTAQNQPNERGLGAGRHPLGAVAHRGNGLQDRFALVRRNIPTAVHHAGDRRYRYSRRRGDVFHGYFFHGSTSSAKDSL